MVIGVPEKAAPDMVKNFIKVVSNPMQFSPTVYLVPEIIKYDGTHTIIHVHVPSSTEVHSFKKIIYDRVDDSDVKVTATGTIAQMYIRKQGIFTEKKIFPYAKLEDNKVELAREAFDLRLLAEDVLTITHMRAEKAGITLQQEDCSKNMEYPYVYGSPLHIRQIFVNILGNAIKYNKPGGTVSMKIETGEKHGHQISYICTIADTGIGMAPEFLEHLFEPFAQEKTDARSVYQGTGLGMAIVKALVDKMGGTIRVQSEVNVGTEFVVEIPFEIAEEKDVVVEKMELDQASVEGVKILIAEDNELNMEIATELLKESGAIITQVTNGKDAVEMFVDNPPGTFDVILMDIMMPVLNGLEATKAIRVLERKDAMEIPIIALTANAFFDDIQKSREAGMNAHLAKPFDIEKMIQTIAGFTKK